jgi:hypothetical protein
MQLLVSPPSGDTMHSPHVVISRHSHSGELPHSIGSSTQWYEAGVMSGASTTSQYSSAAWHMRVEPQPNGGLPSESFASPPSSSPPFPQEPSTRLQANKSGRIEMTLSHAAPDGTACTRLDRLLLMT